ncbi:DUF488 domain-containing protein [Lederbergia lenta]|uniref:Uncharacterized conserved protein n=1 Tax=Lederbergia lenta TaxID=1467 RepID=A0A2X4X0M4_LEDLE|nr:DUF488 family protein [Lederbergia lenta]MCM3112907.1 DUF488 family protein [Lederbergia lenta]MEC2326126.1 DUF488 family protein [Lederbergia lenta]SQI63500.1 Uncharacterized conserved protein [Lederbergia lenta]
MPIKLKRAYEAPSSSDGVRVLVDRIWPRGVSKESLKMDHWMKEVAPSEKLRKWFGHDPKKYEQFKDMYKGELQSNEEMKKQLEQLKQVVINHKKYVTLVYGAKDEKHNQAAALKEILDRQRV